MNPFLSGFRSNDSSKHALLYMIEKWHKELDSGKLVASVLTDLSKAFDCINHRLLIAELHAYGFSRFSLGYIYSYLSDRSQQNWGSPQFCTILTVAGGRGAMAHIFVQSSVLFLSKISIYE